MAILRSRSSKTISGVFSREASKPLGPGRIPFNSAISAHDYTWNSISWMSFCRFKMNGWILADSVSSPPFNAYFYWSMETTGLSLKYFYLLIMCQSSPSISMGLTLLTYCKLPLFLWPFSHFQHLLFLSHSYLQRWDYCSNSRDQVFSPCLTCLKMSVPSLRK